MRIQISCEELKQILSSLKDLLDPRSTIPAFAYIGLKADEEGVLFSVFNSSSFLGIEKGACLEPGKVCVYGTDFINLIDKLNAIDNRQTIDLEFNQEKFKVSWDTGQANLPFMDYEFHTVPQIVEENQIELDADILNLAWGLTLSSGTDEIARPMLTTSMIHFKEDFIFFEAMDGFRVAHVSFNAQNQVQGLALIPIEVAKNFLKLGAMGQIKLSLINSNRIQIQGNGFLLETSTIQGTPPDTSNHLSTKNLLHKVTLNPSELKQAVDLAYQISKSEVNFVLFDFKEGSLNIRANNQYNSELSQKVEFYGFEGTQQLGLNAKYLSEALKDLIQHLKPEEVEFYFLNEFDRILIKAGNFKYAQMQMTLRNKYNA